MKPVKSVLLALGSVALAGYVLAYLPRRSAGGYRLTQSGEIRLGGGSALSDMQQWSPEDCWWQPHFRSVSGEYVTRSDRWGQFFAPLIGLDRKFNFPDRPVYIPEALLEQTAPPGN